MKKLILENLDCANCAAELEGHLKKLSFVKSARIHFPTLTLQVATEDLDGVKAEIAKREPHIVLREPGQSSPQNSGSLKKEGWTLGILGTLYFGLLIPGLVWPGLWPQAVELAGFLGIFLATGFPVLGTAFRKIRQGNFFEENLLMSTATITALILGAYAEAAGVMVFYRTGEFFQELAVARSRKSLGSLMALRPDQGRRITEAGEVLVPAMELVPGDRIAVLPGERISADAQVLQGHTEADTSALSGESLPRSLGPGDEVKAGWINLSGRITAQVLRPLEETSLQKVLHLVEEAAQRKGSLEQFFTRFARVYTPAVFFLALLTAVIPPLVIPGQSFQDWIYRALVVLMVSCPCALVISIPLTYFGGLGAAGHRGILIKGSQFLDALAKVQVLGMDKTGTLTRGQFSVTHREFPKPHQESLARTLAAGLGRQSHHPAAQALAADSGGRPELSEVQEFPGRGIRGLFEGRPAVLGKASFLKEQGIGVTETPGPWTETYLGYAGELLGVWRLQDQVKPEAQEALKSLGAWGIEGTILLSGDRAEPVALAAAQAGIKEFHGELLPEEKLAHWQRFTQDGKLWGAFVGDGINDAPVLASGRVGIAMGGRGIDAAMESADVVLMHDRLTDLSLAFRIARKTQRILWQNILLALGVKGFFIILGLAGEATMWEAVFGDVGVALLAIANSLRILRV